jgi:hypothetical protein
MTPFGSRLAPHRLVGVGRAIGKGSALQRGPSPALGGPPPRRRLAARLAVVAATIALLGIIVPVSGVLAAAASANGAVLKAVASGTSTSGATAITAGEFHTCALLAGGSVGGILGGSIDCWGSNLEGQLGNGTTTNSTTPVAVSGLTTATAFTAGLMHTCALFVGGGGGVDCWGDNQYGQLGNGTTTNSSDGGER